ncbi:MAG: hypothetical protein Tsb009_10980 [Planctomycetaceae bacterium]
MRIERPRKLRRPGRRYLDNCYFEAGFFIRHVARRLATLGIQPDSPEVIDHFGDEAASVVQSHLVWIDVAYGGRGGKTLGGLVGRVILATNSLAVRAALVWGQYGRLGKNTHFGFGRYRIEELGDDPFACRRAVPLLKIAWKHPSTDAVVQRVDLQPGELAAGIRQIRDGTYQPDPYHTVTIGLGDDMRRLQIPSRRDRVLQRLVLEVIGPGVDQLFESSHRRLPGAKGWGNTVPLAL